MLSSMYNSIYSRKNLIRRLTLPRAKEKEENMSEPTRVAHLQA